MEADETKPVTVAISRDLAQKMTRPWYLVKKREADAVRKAFSDALAKAKP